MSSPKKPEVSTVDTAAGPGHSSATTVPSHSFAVPFVEIAGRRKGTGPARASAVRGGGVRRPRVAVQQHGPADIEQAGAVRAAEAEPTGHVDVDRRDLPGRERGRRHRDGVRVVAVLEHVAGDVHRGGPGVDELDPVDRRPATGLDLVDADRRAVVRAALGGGEGLLQHAGAVRAEPEGDRGVGGTPGLLVDQRRAVREEEARLVVVAEAEAAGDIGIDRRRSRAGRCWCSQATSRCGRRRCP